MEIVDMVVALFKSVFSLLRGEEQILVARMPLATVGQSLGFGLVIASLRVGAFCLVPALFVIASVVIFVLLCGAMSLFFVFIFIPLLGKTMFVVFSVTICQWILLASLTFNALFIWAWRGRRKS